MAQKFIIQGNTLKLGHVDFHRELANLQGEPIKGGGWFHIDMDRKNIYFYNESIDFGKVDLTDLQMVRSHGLYQPSLEELVWHYSDTNVLEEVFDDNIVIR